MRGDGTPESLPRVAALSVFFPTFFFVRKTFWGIRQSFEYSLLDGGVHSLTGYELIVSAKLVRCPLARRVRGMLATALHSARWPLLVYPCPTHTQSGRGAKLILLAINTHDARWPVLCIRPQPDKVTRLYTENTSASAAWGRKPQAAHVLHVAFCRGSIFVCGHFLIIVVGLPGLEFVCNVNLRISRVRVQSGRLWVHVCRRPIHGRVFFFLKLLYPCTHWSAPFSIPPIVNAIGQILSGTDLTNVPGNSFLLARWKDCSLKPIPQIST